MLTPNTQAKPVFFVILTETDETFEYGDSDTAYTVKELYETLGYHTIVIETAK